MGTAARPPGAISTASLARRSAPAAPAEAYSGSEPPASTRAGRGTGARRGVGHRAFLGALREDPQPSDGADEVPRVPARVGHARVQGYDRADGPAQSLRDERGRARRARRGERRARLPRPADLRLALPPPRARRRRDGQPAQAPARRPRGGLRAALARGGGARALLRRHAQVPLPARRRRHDRGRLHPRGRPPHDLHLDPGRLPAQVRVLPHRHRRLQAQPEDLGDPRPGGDRDGGAPGRPRPTRTGAGRTPSPGTSW